MVLRGVGHLLVWLFAPTVGPEVSTRARVGFVFRARFCLKFCHTPVVLERMYFSWFTFFVSRVVEFLDTKRVIVLTCERLL